MTRFARARGSKASNERFPEDSTPWEVMKEQLLQAKKNNDDSKKRKEAEDKRIENYENFLKEQKVQKRKATWCDFPEDKQKEMTVSDSSEPKSKKKKKKKKNVDQLTLNTDLSVSNEVENNTEGISNMKKSKKKKNKSKTDSEPQANNISTDSVVSSPGSKKKKRKIVDQLAPNEIIVNNEDENHINQGNSVKKSKKKENKSQTISESQNNTESGGVVQSSSSRKKNKKVKGKIQKTESNETKFSHQPNETQDLKTEDKQQDINKKKANQQQQKQKKNKNLVDGKPRRRKEISNRSFQLIINGREIELVRFDGFPVMRKDADRLEELKLSMIKKGIPKSEVQRTIKLERRRAEKALARVKRDVCYNCRKGGHVLSDCPELKSKIPGAEVAEGVCFKCGSTEHRQFECKVQREKEFRFATCFICKEAGHIARQCPDNPKGLYPDGGSCKLCGDVTHLRKDCPTVVDKKESSSIKLQTLDYTENIEDVDQQTNKLTVPETNKKPKKIRF